MSYELVPFSRFSIHPCRRRRVIFFPFLIVEFIFPALVGVVGSGAKFLLEIRWFYGIHVDLILT